MGRGLLERTEWQGVESYQLAAGSHGEPELQEILEPLNSSSLVNDSICLLWVKALCIELGFWLWV